MNALESLGGTYILENPKTLTRKNNIFKHTSTSNTLAIHNYSLAGTPDYILTTNTNANPEGTNTNISLFYDEGSGTHTFEVEDANGTHTIIQLAISPKVSTYIPPLSIGKSIQYEDICPSDISDDNIISPIQPTKPSCCDNWWNIPDTMQSCNLTPSYNPFYVIPGNNNNNTPSIYPGLPYYKTNLKITGDFSNSNQKDIMITWALIMDGKYRETELDAGVLNYVEKYVRTSGNAPDGLYCYNFGLQSSPFDFQPSGAMNLSKFRTIEFEISTFAPPSDTNAETLTICDSDGNIVGVNKPSWRVYEYTYNLVVMEERYNILKFISGNAALAYAR